MLLVLVHVHVHVPRCRCYTVLMMANQTETMLYGVSPAVSWIVCNINKVFCHFGTCIYNN